MSATDDAALADIAGLSTTIACERSGRPSWESADASAGAALATDSPSSSANAHR